MPVFLVPVDSGECLIPLEKAIILIGRQSDCDVSLTRSRKISRKHCCIAQVDHKFVVRDLGSTNGVFLNGTRIQKEATISIGDELVIGDVHFRLRNEAPAVSKSKSVKGGGELPKTIEESPVVVPIPPPVPVRSRPTIAAPPSMDIPIALPEGDLDFDIEVTSFNRQTAHRKNRVDDVVPLNEHEQEDDVLRLASDSF